jgi:hypothetical protein
MIDKDFVKRYRESVDLGEDNYSLINEGPIKPIKNDYTYWDDYFESLIKYLKEKYKYTYGSKAKRVL